MYYSHVGRAKLEISTRCLSTVYNCACLELANSLTTNDYSVLLKHVAQRQLPLYYSRPTEAMDLQLMEPVNSLHETDVHMKLVFSACQQFTTSVQCLSTIYYWSSVSVNSLHGTGVHCLSTVYMKLVFSACQQFIIGVQCLSTVHMKLVFSACQQFTRNWCSVPVNSSHETSVQCLSTVYMKLVFSACQQITWNWCSVCFCMNSAQLLDV